MNIFTAYFRNLGAKLLLFPDIAKLLTENILGGKGYKWLVMSYIFGSSDISSDRLKEVL